jgi:hypothetical protein
LHLLPLSVRPRTDGGRDRASGQPSKGSGVNASAPFSVYRCLVRTAFPGVCLWSSLIVKRPLGDGPDLALAFDGETRPGDAPTPGRLDVAPWLDRVNEQTFHIKYQLASDSLGCLELRNDDSHTLNAPLLGQIAEQRVLVRIVKTLKDSSASGPCRYRGSPDGAAAGTRKGRRCAIAPRPPRGRVGTTLGSHLGQPPCTHCKALHEPGDSPAGRFPKVRLAVASSPSHPRPDAGAMGIRAICSINARRTPQSRYSI